MILRRTPLTDAHRAAGARMADFGGWEMPIEYPTGVVAEHLAVRAAVGVFDVSHMGKLIVSGPGACVAVNRILTNDLDRISAGQAQYSMLCNESGGVVDDLIVYRLGTDVVRIVPNAANAGVVRDVLRERVPGGVVVQDLHEVEGILAIQGPESWGVMLALGLTTGESQLPYMACTATEFAGAPVLVCRTGYTGEHGYEVIAPVSALGGLWAAAAERATPCGLGARDTLRTEMGYPLHGQDLTPAITPIEAGLSWAVGWDKPEFVGRAALLAQRAQGRTRALRGLQLAGRGVPRAHMDVRSADGSTAGATTSGTWSPTLRAGIALAFVDPDLVVGDEVSVDIRGRDVPAHIVGLPFVGSSPR